MRKPSGRPRGRQAIYTKALAAQVLARISAGERVTAICRKRGMPSWRTVHRWTKADPGFARAYALAQQFGASALAEEAMTIVDAAADNEASVFRAKAQADQRWLLAGKLLALSNRNRSA
jgi:hypothetical protein